MRTCGRSKSAERLGCGLYKQSQTSRKIAPSIDSKASDNIDLHCWSRGAEISPLNVTFRRIAGIA